MLALSSSQVSPSRNGLDGQYSLHSHKNRGPLNYRLSSESSGTPCHLVASSATLSFDRLYPQSAMSVDSRISLMRKTTNCKYRRILSPAQDITEVTPKESLMFFVGQILCNSVRQPDSNDSSLQLKPWNRNEFDWGYPGFRR